MIVEISVIPNSRKFTISVKNGVVKVYLKKSPENNKANIELITQFSKLFNKEVHLISGHKSKHKKLAIAISEEEWKEFVKAQT
ncbi:MAG: DUF167 domain-containing protein [Candidatus Micrarchaeota archaeon]